jgi:hypothetical protein
MLCKPARRFYIMVKSAAMFDDDNEGFRHWPRDQATLYGRFGGYDCGLSVIGPLKPTYTSRCAEHNTIAWIRFSDRTVSVYRPAEYQIELNGKRHRVEIPCWWNQPPAEHHHLLLQMLTPEHLQ